MKNKFTLIERRIKETKMKIKFKNGEEVTIDCDSNDLEDNVLTLSKEDKDGDDVSVAMINFNEVLYIEE